jgi:hypothetical protein
MKNSLGRLAAAFSAASALALAGTAIASAATQHAVIDFEGLAAGTVVNSLSNGSGISGDPIPGSVGVYGDSANKDITTNAALIFDATCAGSVLTCSGGDPDLYKPLLGNVMIMAENLIDRRPADGRVDDPDDADLRKAPFFLDFAGFGPGFVTIDSIDLMDIEPVEAPATLKVYDGSTLVASIPVGPTGDNGLVTVPVGATGDEFVITLEGSGAIDNIRLSTEEVDLANGRFTGGGNQVRIGEARVTRGLTIHCDLLLSNNLEVNWGGDHFHMTEHLTTVECSDHDDIIQAPPAAPLDTLIGVGTGRYNGTDGYTIEFTLVDYGEPGSEDRMAILIYETADPSNVALDVPLQLLSGGNLQAHYDQPHK